MNSYIAQLVDCALVQGSAPLEWRSIVEKFDSVCLPLLLSTAQLTEIPQFMAFSPSSKKEFKGETILPKAMDLA